MSGPESHDQRPDPATVLQVFSSAEFPEVPDHCHEEVKNICEEQRILFAKQAQKHEADLIHNMRERTQRVDLLEVCCPWDSPLSQAVEQAGGRVYRMGLHNGYDLSTKVGFTKALATLRRLRPRYVHVSPPCHPWSSLMNACQRTPEQRQQLLERRKNSRKILKHCEKLVMVQRQELHGQTGCGRALSGHAGGEHPLRASSWKEPSMRRMVRRFSGVMVACSGWFL